MSVSQRPFIRGRSDLRYARRSMFVYAATIFLSAFLLFQVQPMIAKFILPWFGGSAAVWSASLLFFQLLLLAGYLYAHCLIRYVKPKRQVVVHLTLLVISLVTLPIIPKDYWKPVGGTDPLLGDRKSTRLNSSH